MDLYICEICSKPFKRKEHLTRHKRSHSSDRPFTCPICVRSFTRQDSLLRHLSSHAKPPARGSQKQSNGLTQPNDKPDTVTVPADLNCAAPASELPDLRHQPTADFERLPPDANADHGDLDIPPELANNLNEPIWELSSATRCIADSTTENCDPSRLTIEFFTPAGGLSAPYLTSPQSIGTDQTQGTPELPEIFDWPEALYSSTVDRHARSWLKDLCAREAARTGTGAGG